jgi:hypothetical protein
MVLIGVGDPSRFAPGAEHGYSKVHSRFQPEGCLAKTVQQLEGAASRGGEQIDEVWIALSA